MAIGALDAVRSTMGMKVPDDISIIGFDDIPMASWPCFNLTTVRQPVNLMVDGSVKDLNARIKKPETTPSQKVIKGELVYRGSARIAR